MRMYLKYLRVLGPLFFGTELALLSAHKFLSQICTLPLLHRQLFVNCSVLKCLGWVRLDRKHMLSPVMWSTFFLLSLCQPVLQLCPLSGPNLASNIHLPQHFYWVLSRPVQFLRCGLFSLLWQWVAGIRLLLFHRLLLCGFLGAFGISLV